MEKLIFLACIAAGQALNVDKFLQDALTQIYWTDGDVQYVSLEPYLYVKMNSTYSSSGYGSHLDACTAEGHYGLSEEIRMNFKRSIKQSFNRQMAVIEISSSDEGNADATLLPLIWPMMSGKHLLTNHEIIFDSTRQTYSLTNSGNVDGHEWVLTHSGTLRKYKESRRGGKIEFVFSGHHIYDQYFEDWNAASWLWVPRHNYELTTKAEWTPWNHFTEPRQTVCAPDQCEAILTFEGVINDENVHYKITNQFSENGNDVTFTIKLFSNNRIMHTITVDIGFQGQGDYSHPHSIFPASFYVRIYHQAVNAERQHVFSMRIMRTISALFDFSEYFPGLTRLFDGTARSNWGGLSRRPDMLPYVVVWADIIFNDFTTEFDCSAFVERTGFESGILAEFMGVSSMQDMLQNDCRKFNDCVVENLKSASPYIKLAREYLNGLTDEDVGGMQFDGWYDSLF